MVRRWKLAVAVALAGGIGCGESGGGDSRGPSDAGVEPDAAEVGETDDDAVGGGGDVVPDVDEEGCPRLFAQDVFPEWRVTMSESEWAALEDEFYNRDEHEAAGDDLNPYHPTEEVTYDDGSGPVEVPLVLIRLKGESSWVQTLEFDDNPKMQFVLAFNEVDPDGRFMGVRKVELDMPRTDWSYLRQRLGLHTIRKIGQPAQCANNARLHMNGEYYGLYTHLERLDKEFLQRVYGKDGGADDGDLWKAGYEIRTNDDSYSEARIDALWSATSPTELSGLASLDDALFEWAAEALLPHADGYHFGRPNFFLYDHPGRGFLWIPSDLDTAFDYKVYSIDLAYPRSSWREYWFWIPYSTVLNDPVWMDRYVETIARVRDRIDPDEQVALLEQWAAQISSAAEADPHRPFSVDDHESALEAMRDYLGLRHDFVGEWVTCRESGSGYDGDEDGTVFCSDCDDEDPVVHPGAVEACNQLDDDCDGAADEGVSCP
jgi:hypothetical protein